MIWFISIIIIFYLLPVFIFAAIDTDDLQVLAWTRGFPIGGHVGFILFMAWWFWPIAIYVKAKGHWPWG